MEPNAAVYVVDDDPAARASVAALARSKGLNVHEFDSAEQFLAAHTGKEKGCLVIDVRMTGISGIELQQRLADSGRSLPIILITGFANIPMAVRAMRNGAVSFLEKPCSPQELGDNIDLALQIDQEKQRLHERKRDLQAKFASLTPDENEVLGKVIEGLPNKRIASDLDIGLRTVELRRSNIMKKTGAHSLAELVRLAMEADILPSVE